MVLVSKFAAFSWMSKVPIFQNSNLPKHHYLPSPIPTPQVQTFVLTNNLYPSAISESDSTLMFDPFFDIKGKEQRLPSLKQSSFDLYMKNPTDVENQQGLDKYKWDANEPNYSCPVKRWGVMS